MQKVKKRQHQRGDLIRRNLRLLPRNSEHYQNGLNAVEDEMNNDTRQQPARSSADDRQSDTEESDGGNHAPVWQVLRHVDQCKHRQHDYDGPDFPNKPLQRGVKETTIDEL